MASKRIIYIFLYFLLLALSCIITEAKKKVKAEGASVPLAGPTATSDNVLESAPPVAIDGPVENGNDTKVTPGYTPVTSVSSTTVGANPSSQITGTPAGLPANVDAPAIQSQTSAILSQTLSNQPTTSPQPAQLNASQPALPNQVQPTSQPTLQPTLQASQTVQPAPPASKPTEPPKSNQKNNDNTDSNDSDAVEADDNNPQQTVYAVAPGKPATQLDSTSGASTVIMTRKSDYYSGIMAALSMVVIGSVLMI